MTQAWFVTGTDTGVGKTLVSTALLTALVRDGRRAVGMKPVASGCEVTTHGLRSADAEALRAAGNVDVEYHDCNPFALAAPTAPHLAAHEAGVQIDIPTLTGHYRRLAASAECVVVEGIGGWQVPINRHQTMADVVQALRLPVILVVPLRLGCLNHALLTQQAIAASGCRLVAWVANRGAAELPGYRQALQERLNVPCLAVLPVVTSASAAATHMNLTVLTGNAKT